MSRTVSYQIPEEVYEAIEQRASRLGLTTEECALEWLARHASRPLPKFDGVEGKAARERFEQLLGAVSMGYSTGADNESIDADLAVEHGGPHATEA